MKKYQSPKILFTVIDAKDVVTASDLTYVSEGGVGDIIDWNLSV